MTALDSNQLRPYVPTVTMLPPPPQPQQQRDPMSLHQLLPVIRRRFPLFVTILISVMALSLLAALALPREYAAEAKLNIDPRPHASPVQTQSNNFAAADTVLVDTEVGVMTSPSITRAVVQRLNLVKDPEFASKDDTKRPIDAAAENLRRHVGVGREGLTYIVSVRATSRSPAKAALIANTVADEYLRQSKQLRAAAAADQARTLTAELGPLGQQVVAAEAAVAAYRASHGIIATGNGHNETGTVTDQQIGTIATELGRASADAAAANAAAIAAQAQAQRGGAESVSQVLNSASLTELRNQRAQVLREQAQVLTVYGPEHPAAVRVTEQLAKLDREIDVAAARVVGGLRSDAGAAQARAATLRAQLAALQAQQSTDAKAGVNADSLQRDADAKRATYNQLNQNAQQQAQEARIGDVRAWLVSPAIRALKPSFPNKPIFLMIGFILGSAIGSGAAIAAELSESGFRSAEEIEGELGIPFLASVAELPAETKGRRLLGRRGRGRRTMPWDYVVNKPTSTFAESFRNIRGTLLPLRGKPEPTAICVTSALAGEGKTATAATLARVMAMSGDRVLLIDCDLRRNGLASLRPRPREDGQPVDLQSTDLIEVLSDGSDPAKATNDDIVPGLTVLGLRAPVFTSRDIFSGDVAREVLARLKSEYDFIILDTPPVLALTDAWIISSLCDTTLLVVRHTKTPRDAVRAAADRLKQAGANLHGVVLNRRSPKDLSPSDPARYDRVNAAYYQH